MTLLTYARDPENNMAMFAVIAQEDSADYLFPEDVTPWLTDERINTLVELQGGSEPTNQRSWMDLATTHLGRVLIDPPVEFGDVDAAVSAADLELSKFQGVDKEQHRLDAASDAFDTVSADYPGFMESDEDTSAEAMNAYVMQVLGPIDPNGPNGWILRAQEGKPLPGDEDQYIHWPGSPLADDPQSLADENPDLEFELDPAPEPDDEESEPVPDDEQEEDQQ